MRNVFILFFSVLTLLVISTSCRKTDNPFKYDAGTFPDTTIALTDINSAYDDYNMSLNQIQDNIVLVFSSNRVSTGEQFDLEQGIITYSFDQTTGEFGLGSEITGDPFLSKLIGAAVTEGDDLGPYRLFNREDGYEYLILSSENNNGDLDFFYLRNLPVAGNSLPDISGPSPVNLLNTSADDAYICFNATRDTLYFATDYQGNFDIFFKGKPSSEGISEWFNSSYSTSSEVDSINSSFNDKCPFVLKKIMVFASDRSGGLGGFDLYYSLFINGKWNSPVNFGPEINTKYNEYRPVIGFDPSFTNNFMIFSSDRPGGKGLFDLYFKGITFEN